MFKLRLKVEARYFLLGVLSFARQPFPFLIWNVTLLYEREEVLQDP